MSFSPKPVAACRSRQRGRSKIAIMLTWERRIEEGKKSWYGPRQPRTRSRWSKRLISAPGRGEGAASGDRLLRRGPRVAAPSRAIQVAERFERSRSPVGGVLRLLERTHSDCRSERLVPSRGHCGREPRRPVSSRIRSGSPGGLDDAFLALTGCGLTASAARSFCQSSGRAQPFSNLSAGQRMMLALVADIAIKAVTQNNYLVPEESPAHSNGAVARCAR